MTIPAPTLPTPPAGDRRWSVCTIARHLCVAPHVAYAALEAGGFTEDESGFTAPRYHHSYDMPGLGSGASYGDVYLTDEAVEHLRAVLPIGPLARAVAAGEAVALNWSEIHAMAQHIVEHRGGGA